MTITASRLARWSFAALLPIAACSSNPAPAPTPAAPPPAPLTEQDSGFVNMATLAGLAEVQDGQLAATQATRPAVKAFGQEMVTDHTQANQQLASIATAHGVTLPTTLSDADQAAMTKLAAMKRGFDAAYLHAQITGHMKMLKALQMEVGQGTDPDLKAYAQATIPVVQKHLSEARALSGMRRR